MAKKTLYVYIHNRIYLTALLEYIDLLKRNIYTHVNTFDESIVVLWHVPLHYSYSVLTHFLLPHLNGVSCLYSC